MVEERFVTAASNKTIHAEWWGDNESVTIKRFNYGDRQDLMAASLDMKLTESGAQVNELQLARMNLSILETAIVSWTLIGPDGLVPVNAEWIRKLGERDAHFILTEINTLNPRRTADAQAGFRGKPGDSVAK